MRGSRWENLTMTRENGRVASRGSRACRRAAPCVDPCPHSRGRRGKTGDRGDTGSSGTPGEGAIIPFASLSPSSATFNVMNPIVAVVGFGFASNIGEPEFADLGAISPFGYVPFSLPRPGVVRSMNARLRLAGPSLPTEDLVFHVQLREQAPGDNNNFTTIRATFDVPFTRPFPSPPVASGSVDLFIPLVRGTRLLVSVSVTATSTSAPGGVGFFTSAGLAIS